MLYTPRTRHARIQRRCFPLCLRLPQAAFDVYVSLGATRPCDTSTHSSHLLAQPW